jgi:hypothetical protein
MDGLVLFVLAALVLGAMAMLADRFGVDSRDQVGDAHTRGTH